MRFSRFALGTSLLCAAAIVLVGCSAITEESATVPDSSNLPEANSAADSAKCGPLEEMTTVTLGINPGSQSLIIEVMKSQGIDKKYNLNVDVKKFLNPPAAATAMTQKVVDIGYGGITTMAIAREQGSDVFFFGPFITTPQDGVFVPKDSPVKSLSDLKGKKIGSFSGTSSATTAILSAIADKSYDMPKLSELSDVVVAPAPALFGLLDKGEVDAVLTVDTDTVQADLTGKYNKILVLSDAYEDAFGTNPMFVGLVSNEAFAENNCSALQAFYNAQMDTIDYVKSHDEVWKNYADSLKVTDPAAPAALQKLAASFTTDWSEEEVKSVTDLLETLIPILGSDAFIKNVPEGLFDLDYSTK